MVTDTVTRTKPAGPKHHHPARSEFLEQLVKNTVHDNWVRGFVAGIATLTAMLILAHVLGLTK